MAVFIRKFWVFRTNQNLTVIFFHIIFVSYFAYGCKLLLKNASISASNNDPSET